MRVTYLKYAKRALRNTIVEALGASVTRVSWGPHPATPRAKRPFCRLSFTQAPSADLTSHDEERQVLALDEAVFTVDTATVGNTYQIRLNGFPFSYQAVGGDDLEAIRDGLLTAINAESLTSLFTVAAIGLNGITATPAAPGLLFAASIAPANDTTLAPTTSSVQSTLWVGRRVALVRCEFLTDGERKLEDGAMDLASTARAAFSRTFSRNLQALYRVPLRALADTQHLPDLEPGGAEVESRAAFEVHMALSSCAVEVSELIESVEITSIVSGEANTYLVTS